MTIDPSRVLEVLDVLLRALGTRLLCIAALTMSFILFGWAMWRGTTLAFWTAVGFAIAALLPVLSVTYLEQRSKADGRPDPPQSH